MLRGSIRFVEIGSLPDPEQAFLARALRDRQRIDRLMKRLSPDAWSRVADPLRKLEEIAHGLAGTCGMYGLPHAGETAARIERLAERWRLNPPATLSKRRLAILMRIVAILLEELKRVGPADHS